MKRISTVMAAMLAAAGLLAAGAQASPLTAHMRTGNPSLLSSGPLAFGPEGILFIGDPKAASIIAVDTGDKVPGKPAPLVKVEGISQKIADVLGTTPDQILIEDMVVNPATKRIYFSVSRGRGPEALPAILRLVGDKPEVVSLENVKYSKAALPDAPADAQVGQANRQSNPRRESITDVAYHGGKVLVAGLANEEFASTLRAIPFPFTDSVKGTQVEIYHGAHGQFETRAPVRTFVAYDLGGVPHLIAAYTCTPLVQIPLSELKPGAKVKGKTIAELGNRNRPLDMIVYQKEGKNYLLMANSSRGVMKIPTDGISNAASIETRVADKQGLGYDTIAALTGVDQLDRFDKDNVVVLRRAEGGALSLETLPLP